MNYDYIAFCDGSSVKKGDFIFNGGAATVLLENETKQVYQKGKSLPDRSNNYAELYAVLLTFEMVKNIHKGKGVPNILIISDSKYVVDIFSSWVYSWSKGKDQDEPWERKTGKLSNEKIIKHIFYEYIANGKFNVTFVHMNSHKKFTEKDINEMKRKTEKQGFTVSKDTIKVFIKYNSMADKLAYKYSSSA